MKTIFVSVPNQLACRYYALFDGSVLDLLANAPDTRVVVLVKKNVLPELVAKYKNSRNVAVEEYIEYTRRTLLQRMFMFFYNYLIFTPTTKLVSSYGVRADKPRPLYRFWNYPIKIFLANVVGKSEYIKEVLTPKLYLKIFNERRYAYLFEKYKPDLVFLVNVCSWPLDLEFLVESKRRNIKTVGMAANWDHLSKYFIPFRPDKFLAWSPPIKEEALKYQGYKKENMKIVGAPQIDFYLDEKNILPRGEFLKMAGFPGNAKVAAFFSQGPYSLDGPDLIDMMLKWIAEERLPQNLHIIIRPHPHGIAEKERYEIFRKNPRIYIDDVHAGNLKENAVNYFNVLKHPDVGITTYSTIAAELMVYDRPTIIAGFDGYKKRPIFQSVRRHKNFTHFRHILSFGAIKVAESQEDLLKYLREYLENPKADGEKRLKLREEVFGYVDRQTSRRIFREL